MRIPPFCAEMATIGEVWRTVPTSLAQFSLLESPTWRGLWLATPSVGRPRKTLPIFSPDYSVASISSHDGTHVWQASSIDGWRIRTGCDIDSDVHGLLSNVGIDFDADEPSAMTTATAAAGCFHALDQYNAVEVLQGSDPHPVRLSVVPDPIVRSQS